MGKFFFAVIAAACLMMTGCSTLSPRIDQDIDNTNGRIDNMETITNGFKNEIGKLQNQNEIQNSKIGQMQNGIANIQSSFENNGFALFSGSGGLLLAVVSLVGVFGMVAMTLHYKGVARKKEMMAEILAVNMVHYGTAAMVDDVFKAAMHTEVEEDVLRVIQKHQRA